MKARLGNQYTRLQQEVIGSLAKIEQEDADRCAGCGGEDCICCECYHDRQKWVGPDELFAEDDPFCGWHDDDGYYADDYDEEDDE